MFAQHDRALYYCWSKDVSVKKKAKIWSIHGKGTENKPRQIVWNYDTMFL